MGREAGYRYGATLRSGWVSARRIGKVVGKCASWTEGSSDYRDKAIEILWNALPGPIRSWKLTRAIGHLIHRRVRRVEPRIGTLDYTRFFRNRPQLELLRDIVLEMPRGVPLRLAVLGCSTGAELYSAVWMVRTARPEAKVRALGIDISETSIRAAASGVYALDGRELMGVSEPTLERMFTRQGDTLKVQGWLSEDITWRVGDASSSDLVGDLGQQDIVLANNFLCHMSPERAETCLKNIVRLIVPNGYLFVCGIDLDLRSRAVRELGLTPVGANFDTIYTADESALKAWPFRYWGVEPINRNAPDWPVRYTSVFRLPDSLEVGL
jgi:SAM-dependent methyltransferase